MSIPFTEKTQLNHQLKAVLSDVSKKSVLVRADETEYETLPGQPRVFLGSPNLCGYLEKEFLTPDLNTLAPYLWLVATQSSSNIASLHEHVAKGRNIVITENPELHLVWTERHIYIKPIPRFILSYAFWTVHLSEDLRHCPSFDAPDKSHASALSRAILGYMRTYYYLIHHESDFHIARDTKLLPFDDCNITFESFFHFIAGFGDAPDDIVSPRYSSSGVLCLSRLNFWAKVFLCRFRFLWVYGRYSDYIARFYAPIFFIFGMFTLALSALQVGLAVNPSIGVNNKVWTIFQRGSLWFSVATFLCVCCIGFILAMMSLFLVFRELRFATKDLLKWRRKKL